ncbi:MAG: DUF1415 domain-containing protein [Gammaproteobacteria bacterium]
MNDEAIITATQRWLESFIIAFNICPFALREQRRNSIRYRIARVTDVESALQALIAECIHLDASPETETTLLIFPSIFDNFDAYLDMLVVAEQLLIAQGYEGIYQLASFHPDYCFETDRDVEDDPANYTNRSPYPMLHIIREASIERAIANYPDPENIPDRNIKLTRQMGVNKLKALLVACQPKP